MKQLIYDLPTRIFHWLFAMLFVLAFFIAKTVDDDNPIFSYHMLAGLMLATIVSLRLLWGLFGTKYARFSSFALHPKEFINYLQGIFNGSQLKWSGHNPASSWASLIMFICTFMLAFTGYMMTTGQKESFEDAHELFANAFLVTVLLHIAGILLHTFRHNDGIAFSMIHGKKEVTEPTFETVKEKPIVAVFFVLLLVVLSGALLKNYNKTSGELKLFGKTLLLGENEQEDKNEEEHEDDDDDDD